LTATNLKQSSPDSKMPRENWARMEEAENFERGNFSHNKEISYQKLPMKQE